MHRLIWGQSFVRGYKRVAKRNPALAGQLEETLNLLARDPFSPRLETHKLKGKLAGAWACSLGYDLRVIFDFCRSQSGVETDILLMDIGTHDEVY